MLLWTIQPLEVLEILDTKGVFTCDETSKSFNNDLKDSYDWLVKKMDEKGIVHPKELHYPIWAWHTMDWKHEKLDLTKDWYDEEGAKRVCLEIEIPDNEVLLSDFNLWHFVLNKSWIDDSTNEVEYDKMHEEFDKLDRKTKNELTVKSWEKIFNVKPFIIDNWIENGRFVQAVFWTLKKEQVKDVRFFTCK